MIKEDEEGKFCDTNNYSHSLFRGTATFSADTFDEDNWCDFCRWLYDVSRSGDSEPNVTQCDESQQRALAF